VTPDFAAKSARVGYGPGGLGGTSTRVGVGTGEMEGVDHIDRFRWRKLSIFRQVIGNGLMVHPVGSTVLAARAELP
jgi:hypothetical protein